MAKWPTFTMKPNGYVALIAMRHPDLNVKFDNKIGLIQIDDGKHGFMVSPVHFVLENDYMKRIDSMIVQCKGIK